MLPTECHGLYGCIEKVTLNVSLLSRLLGSKVPLWSHSGQNNPRDNFQYRLNRDVESVNIAKIGAVSGRYGSRSEGACASFETMIIATVTETLDMSLFPPRAAETSHASFLAAVIKTRSRVKLWIDLNSRVLP